MITKMQVREIAEKAAQTALLDPAGIAETAGGTGAVAEWALNALADVARYALRPAKRRKIFLVTAVVVDGDERTRVTYGVAARNERRAVEMAEQAIGDADYEIKDVAERENPWVVSTGAEG